MDTAQLGRRAGPVLGLGDRVLVRRAEHARRLRGRGRPGRGRGRGDGHRDLPGARGEDRQAPGPPRRAHRLGGLLARPRCPPRTWLRDGPRGRCCWTPREASSARSCATSRRRTGCYELIVDAVGPGGADRALVGRGLRRTGPSTTGGALVRGSRRCPGMPFESIVFHAGPRAEDRQEPHPLGPLRRRGRARRPRGDRARRAAQLEGARRPGGQRVLRVPASRWLRRARNEPVSKPLMSVVSRRSLRSLLNQVARSSTTGVWPRQPLANRDGLA